MNQTIFIERIIWKELHPFQTIYLILFIRGKMEQLIKRILVSLVLVTIFLEILRV